MQKSEMIAKVSERLASDDFKKKVIAKALTLAGRFDTGRFKAKWIQSIADVRQSRNQS
jgi:hypothetical protein